MTKRSASKVSKATPAELLKALLSPPAPPKAKEFTFTDSITKQIDAQSKDKSVSTARYFTFNAAGQVDGSHTTVCFHAIAGNCKDKQGLGIIFQGYPGFDIKNCNSLGTLRKATEEDLYTNKTYPFNQIGISADGSGYYTEESLEWLRFLLDPKGPFKALLPLLAENTPEQVQARRAFIFPDVSLIPARLTWCFAIASRLGFANARTLWRYLHLLEKGWSRPMAALIAGGFEHEIKAGELTGKLIKSYTCGFLGVDTTAYAGRFLSSTPVEDNPYSEDQKGSYGSAEVFKSGAIDIKNLRFDDFEAARQYTLGRAEAQMQELKLNVKLAA